MKIKKMRLAKCISVIFLLFGCSNQNLKKQNLDLDMTKFLKQNFLDYKGITINQEIHCFLNVKTKSGLSGYFSGVPTSDELERKFGNSELLKAMTFCKRNNIYSLETVGNLMILKTGNGYFTFNELGKRNPEYYDNTLKLSEVELETETSGLCYVLGRNDSIINELSENRKVYAVDDSVHYFWTYVPPMIKDCNNGLIK